MDLLAAFLADLLRLREPRVEGWPAVRRALIVVVFGVALAVPVVAFSLGGFDDLVDRQNMRTISIVLLLALAFPVSVAAAMLRLRWPALAFVGVVGLTIAFGVISYIEARMDLHATVVDWGSAVRWLVVAAFALTVVIAAPARIPGWLKAAAVVLLLGTGLAAFHLDLAPSGPRTG